MSEHPTRLALSDRQRLDWLRLLRSETIGPRTFRALLNRHGSAAAVLDALPDLARRGGHTLRIATQEDAEAEMKALGRRGGRIVALGEPDYPLPLETIDSAPPLIAILGDAAILRRPAIAIVGARNASALGQRFAATLARGLGEAGIVVASGLARGIDGAAHEAALASGTVAVLAGGLGRIYPREHEPLADRIVQGGALVSEMPFGWTATGRDFPRRNRIVSGLSYGVVVVEAALRSGSLITARFANEQGREVFAVPGSPLDPRAEGGNRLIRSGATLITCVEDILDVVRSQIETGMPRGTPLREEGSDDSQPLWDEWDEIVDPAPSAPPEIAEPVPAGREALLSLIGTAPVTVDELVRRSGFSLRDVQAGLMELDLQGRLARHGESRVSLALKLIRGAGSWPRARSGRPRRWRG